MRPAQRGEEAARRAFDRAVARERAAIETHERAAVLHDAIARRLDEAAAEQDDEDRVAALTRRAATERGRALDARRRAQGVIDRLVAEGVAVDGGAADGA